MAKRSKLKLVDAQADSLPDVFGVTDEEFGEVWSSLSAEIRDILSNDDLSCLVERCLALQRIYTGLPKVEKTVFFCVLLNALRQASETIADTKEKATELAMVGMVAAKLAEREHNLRMKGN